MVEGGAGASARREYERRRARDEARVRERWGRFGGLAVALSDERRSTRAWSTGAVGEQRVGEVLDRLASPTTQVLHDRRIPRSRANIDHFVVTSGGIWVVDTKKYRGRPTRRVEGGVLRPRVEKLIVAGRDRSKLIDGVQWQVEQVRHVVGDVPVTGVLCFVDADWPLFGGAFTISDVHVLWPKRLLSQLTMVMGTVDVADTAQRLDRVFRPS